MKIDWFYFNARAQRFLYIVENIFKSRKDPSLNNKNRNLKKSVCHAVGISAVLIPTE